MNFSRAQTSIPRLSERGDNLDVTGRAEPSLRRGCQVEGSGPEFFGGASREGAERECGRASHRRSLHEMRCTRIPRHSVGIALVLPGEVYSGASGGCAFLRVKVANRITFVRPVNPSFPRKSRDFSPRIAQAIRASLYGAARLSHAQTTWDEARLCGAGGHVPDMGQVGALGFSH